ncbi:MAG: DUF4920 domain-containing protein [Chitinophagales bacterium]
MKKMFLPVFAVTILIFSSCSSDAQQTTEQKEEAKEQQADLVKPNSIGGYGKEISKEGAISIPELVASVKTTSTYQGKVQGTVSACCQNKGCWMKMDIGDGQSMMITFKDYGFFVPMDIPGKNVVIEGNATMKTISVEELKHLAMDAGKPQSEIDAITQPKEELVFVADGVIAL